MFWIVKVNYESRYYTKDDVTLMVEVNFITKDDFKTIVGIAYDDFKMGSASISESESTSVTSSQA